MTAVVTVCLLWYVSEGKRCSFSRCILTEQLKVCLHIMVDDAGHLTDDDIYPDNFFGASFGGFIKNEVQKTHGH